jgi:hypothetical protein
MPLSWRHGGVTSSTLALHAAGPPPTAALVDGRAATYGELVRAATVRVTAACTQGCGPFESPGASLTAAINYERLLALAGHHLRLLTAHPSDPAQHRASTRLSRLIERLTGLDHQAGGDDPWGSGAAQLAAAHDLLATHVGPAGERRTPEADLLDDPGVRDTAVARVLALLRPALERSEQLLAHARDARRAQPAEPGIDRSRATHLRQTTRSLRILAAVPGTGPRPAGDGTLTELDALSPAQPRIAERPANASFDTAVGALQILRLLSYRQALGEDRASPASLHDLARLAIVTSSAAPSWLPEPTTPLARVQHTVACEQLQATETAWQAVQTVLGQHVRGLTRAPRMYADAVRAATSALPHDPVLGAAALSALPRLGRDAGTTVEVLASSGDLVIATKQVGRTQASWRRPTPDETEHIAGTFHTASRVSDQAHATYLHSIRGTQPRERQPAVPSQVRRLIRTVGGRTL